MVCTVLKKLGGASRLMQTSPAHHYSYFSRIERLEIGRFPEPSQGSGQTRLNDLSKQAFSFFKLGCSNINILNDCGTQYRNYFPFAFTCTPVHI